MGHRVGPDHVRMLAKQQHMNDVLKHVVHALDKDTLLVVLGDHVMDRKDDHGGDSDIFHIKHSLAKHLHTVRDSKSISCQRSHFFLDILFLLTTSERLFRNFFWWDLSGSQFTKSLYINARQVHACLTPNRTALRAVSSMAYRAPWQLLGHVSMPASQRTGQKRQSMSPVSR